MKKRIHVQHAYAGFTYRLTPIIMLKTTTLLLFLTFCSLCAIAQTLTIPTVVHLIHTPGNDISDDSVMKILTIVNQNFGGKSANTVVSRKIFDTLQANTDVRFCLATKDPKGLATSGILHVETATGPMEGDLEFGKRYSTAWDDTRYCNIWLAFTGTESEASSGIASTPALPVGVTRTYGVNIYAGKNVIRMTNTITHELGHFVGLYHTFDEDSVGDTPCSLGAPAPDPCSSGLTENTCSAEDPFWGPIDPPDMIENFMAYSLNCAKMFTKGQSMRLREKTKKHLSSLLANTDVQCAKPTLLKEYETAQPRVYPNPVSDVFQISNISENGTSAEITDMYGRLVAQWQEVTANSKMNISFLPSGLYVLKIINHEQQWISHIQKN